MHRDTFLLDLLVNKRHNVANLAVTQVWFLSRLVAVTVFALPVVGPLILENQSPVGGRLASSQTSEGTTPSSNGSAVKVSPRGVNNLWDRCLATSAHSHS
jgi:hypothetical protein